VVEAGPDPGVVGWVEVERRWGRWRAVVVRVLVADDQAIIRTACG
jgi:hypothetical protein